LPALFTKVFYYGRRYALATSLTAGGLAAQSVTILLGTGALLFGACPCLTSSGPGTAAHGGASPLSSAPRLTWRLSSGAATNSRE